MLSFWPGFQGIARYGLWSQLGLAMLFALMLDVLLIANFYWTSLLTTVQRNGLLIGVLVGWLILLTAANYRRKCFESTLAVDEQDETFRLAQHHYLRGNWFEVESLIRQHLKRKPRDVEMQLLQATLYRHTDRLVEAVAVLDRLDRFDGSGRWLLEIETERQRIVEIRRERAEAEAERLAEVEHLAAAATEVESETPSPHS